MIFDFLFCARKTFLARREWVAGVTWRGACWRDDGASDDGNDK